MPNTKSAKKALRSSLRKRVFNVRRKESLKSAVKEVKQLIGEKKTKEATALLPKAYKAIDKAVKRGVLNKNTGARKKSRLTKEVNKTTAK